MFGRKNVTNRIPIEEALTIIRGRFPECYISSGFPFLNMYVFTIYPKNYKELYTNQAQAFCVTFDGKLKQLDDDLILKHTKEWKRAKKDAVQFDEIDTA